MDVPRCVLKETRRGEEGEGKTCRPRCCLLGRDFSPVLCLLLCLCALCGVTGVGGEAVRAKSKGKRRAMR